MTVRKTTQKLTFRHILTAVCCGLMMMASFYFALTLMSVYIGPVSEDLGVARGIFSVFNMIRYLVAFLVNLVMVRLLKRFRASQLVFVGLAFIGIVFLMVARATTVFTIYAAGILGGVAISFTSVIPLSIILRNWFRKSYGTVLSLVLSASGVAGMVFNPLISRLVAARGWRFSYLVIAGTSLAIAFFNLLFLKDTPEEAGTLLYSDKEEAAPLSEKPAEEEAAPEKKLGFFDKTRDGFNFRICILLSGILTLGTVSVLYGNITVVLLELNYPQVFAAGIVMSVASLTNMVGKLIIGRAVDAFGIKRALRFWYFSCIVSNAFFVIYRGQNETVALIGAAVVGFIGGIYSVPMPLICVRLFRDTASYTTAINYTTAAQNLCAMFASVIFHSIYDFTGTYVNSLLYATGAAIICYVLVVVLFARNRDLIG